MNKEVISNTQGMATIALFIVGSSIVLSLDAKAGKDIWVAIILSLALSVPIILVHSRFLVLFSGKDLFLVFEIVFGKVLGKVFVLIYIWFSFFLAGLVLRVFGDFIGSVSFPETPKIIVMTIIGLLCIFSVKKGIEVIGRFSIFFVIIVMVLMLCITLLLIPQMNINYVLPILREGNKKLLEGTFQGLIFPFTQTIVFSTVFTSLKSNKSFYKVFIFGVLIGGGILYNTSITNLLVLGSKESSEVYFQTYEAVQRISIGGFIERIEIIIGTAFIFGGFVKISICILSTVKGLARLFEFEDYRFLVTPVTLLIINLSYFIHDSSMAKVDFASDIYPFYALPFQIILPLFFLVFTEIKIRTGKIGGYS